MATGTPKQLSFFANGVWADTGRSVGSPSEEAAVGLAHNTSLTPGETSSYIEKTKIHGQPTLGPLFGIDPDNLARAGWGIVFASSTPNWVKDELKLLIDFRREQCHGLCTVFDGESAYKGESCVEWLAGRGGSLRPVDPTVGIPYYLLIVGSPEEIPFEFQYLLDTHFAVGRLDFENRGEYLSYANKVKRYEAGGLHNAGTVTFFATSHESDPATNLFCDNVARVLARDYKARLCLKNNGVHGVMELFAEQATKAALADLLAGPSNFPSPSLVVTGSHGMAFRENKAIEANQGAIVCQDWPGWGSPPRRSEWFGAEDIPDREHGNGFVWFLFACHGGGCPQFTDFPSVSGQREQIAARAIVSNLPKASLSRGGALAVIAHVDKAWAYSIRSRGVGIQLQSFRDVFDRILAGHRVGAACDQFDYSRAVLSMELIETMSAIGYGKRVQPTELADLWTARNDARNYIVIGDPAVRIRTDLAIELGPAGGTGVDERLPRM